MQRVHLGLKRDKLPPKEIFKNAKYLLLMSAESALHCVSFPNSLPPNAVIGGLYPQ